MIEKATKARLREVQLLLREKKARDTQGLFVAEGFKIVRDMFLKGYIPEMVVVSGAFSRDDDRDRFISGLLDQNVPVFEAGGKEFEKISELESSQGILAVIPKKKAARPDILTSDGRLVVLLDGVQDPGNLGAIFRTSAAFGADALLLCGDGVDIYNPKVVRASSGTILDVPVFESSDAFLLDLKKAGYKLWASAVDRTGTKDIRDIKEIPKNLIAAFGSEGKGLSDRIISRADGFFHIRMCGEVESLNVTSAVAISLFMFR